MNKIDLSDLDGMMVNKKDLVAMAEKVFDERNATKRKDGANRISTLAGRYLAGLIRFHVEGNNDGFMALARDVANDMMAVGNRDVAEYIGALVDRNAGWTPMTSK